MLHDDDGILVVGRFLRFALGPCIGDWPQSERERSRFLRKHDSLRLSRGEFKRRGRSDDYRVRTLFSTVCPIARTRTLVTTTSEDITSDPISFVAAASR